MPVPELERSRHTGGGVIVSRWLLLAALATAACDDAAVLANIDTYTCAYLPGVVDCLDTSVHDRAVNLLVHGLTRAHAECSGSVPVSCQNPQDFTWSAHRLQDGSAIVTSNIPVDPVHGSFARSDTRFYGRGEAGLGSLETNIFSVSFSVSSGELTAQESGYSGCGVPSPVVLDIATQCTGFNLEAFGESP